MKLLVDIGNTRVKWALAPGGRVEPPLHVCSYSDCAAAWSALEPEGVLFCSVAPASITRQVLAALPAGAAVTRIESGAASAAVVSHYAEPASLGADRWANLLGARAAFPGRNVVIADAGTAMTVDYLAADGSHTGGAILAGHGVLRAGLAAAAPALPACGGNVTLPPTSTPDAVATGAWLGLAGALERLAGELVPAGEDCLKVLTGGDAAALLPYLRDRWQCDPLLTLRGLAAAGDAACAGSQSSC